MLFNSYEFIFIFLPIVLLTYFISIKFRYTKLATVFLLISSLVFYAYWDTKYLSLLVLSILFNYGIGKAIEKKRSKQLLQLGIIVDLCLLAYFKYIGFFIKTINDTIGTSLFIPDIILPLGISFFTFTQIAFLIDAYRGETENYSFITYSLFVTFFPHLIAGPILYHKDIIPQFSNLKKFVFSHKNMSLGLIIFSIGLFKKVVIADALAPWVKLVFDNANAVTTIEAWIGAVAYALQLYFDFSGYSEMALGLGLMLNINLPINFNSPYRALSIIDFWRRWHITLSVFLKSYLYIPLGGNRQGNIAKMKNLLITMLLGGLWHGAGWTYVIWGGLHGIYLVINHSWRSTNKKLPSFLSWLLTFICITIAWIFFRASTIHDAFSILKAMFGTTANVGQKEILKNTHKDIIILGILLVLIQWRNTQEIVANFYPKKLWIIVISIILLLSLFSLSKTSEFLYFQF
jgi:alginate O-acetyltransferase complex protein AlgI